MPDGLRVWRAWGAEGRAGSRVWGATEDAGGRDSRRVKLAVVATRASEAATPAGRRPLDSSSHRTHRRQQAGARWIHPRTEPIDASRQAPVAFILAPKPSTPAGRRPAAWWPRVRCTGWHAAEAARAAARPLRGTGAAARPLRGTGAAARPGRGREDGRARGFARRRSGRTAAEHRRDSAGSGRWRRPARAQSDGRRCRAAQPCVR